ncbi:AAA family ATPase [Streptomyces sp. NBC_01264]|uniref:AAA family ATPase n=1 Tax=Streptomyces sp. NBC_01264 TaxID=2903804 RepID=UPI0022500722|nr:ArsR family transcriptional regulator [Streptomyces sp. NBC_01264]MCX4781571.1 ArsR family transcriptional regulator [Streptomyces sp. NBC_01264]
MNAVHGQQTPMTGSFLSAKPDRLFGREDEWATLIAFASDPHAGTRLGAVVGRPRQGKTLLLESVAQATGGFYFCGQEATEAESLRRLGEEYARYRQVAPPRHWRDWKEAVDDLLALGDSRPLPVIIDSFPDLVAASPALTSIVHGVLRRSEHSPKENRARLILGGATAPVMNRLFAPSSPLDAVSGLKLDIPPLDFRKAAQLWGFDDLELAFLVYAVVGGTPAYRHDYVGGDVPADRNDFDAWVCRTVLNPRTPLFREARHLVDEETGHQNPGACHSVLAALAAGCTTQGEIAAFLGQQLSDATRALSVLREHGLLLREHDGLRPALVHHRPTDQLLAFDHVVARPRRTALERGAAEAVWSEARNAFNSHVVGPQFAQTCRDWVVHFAPPGSFGADQLTASYGSLGDPSSPTGLEAEVVVRKRDAHKSGALLSVGLARWQTGMDVRHLQQLHSILEALAAQEEDVGRVRLALYGASGFSPELYAAQARDEVMLVDLERLYRDP